MVKNMADMRAFLSISMMVIGIVLYPREGITRCMLGVANRLQVILSMPMADV